MNKIILLGHGVGIKRIIDTLNSNYKLNSKVVAIFTHPYKDHKRDLDIMEEKKDLYGDCAYNVFDSLKDYDIPVIEAENVNNLDIIVKIDSFNPNYIISVGCRNILKKDFLDHFKNKVYNIHTTPLPKYRGAASDTWMILNGEWGKKLYGCFHQIDYGIDTGKILEKEYYRVPNNSYPIDIYKTRMSIFPSLISKSIEALNSGSYNLEEQITDEATTFPRLYTPEDGKINFQYLNGSELERFIYAFSYPFEGAHCFLDYIKINIIEAEFIESQDYHPYTFGIIIGKNNKDQYKVSVKGGILLIKKIKIEGIEKEQRKVFRLGRKLT